MSFTLSTGQVIDPYEIQEVEYFEKGAPRGCDCSGSTSGASDEQVLMFIMEDGRRIRIQGDAADRDKQRFGVYNLAIFKHRKLG